MAELYFDYQMILKIAFHHFFPWHRILKSYLVCVCLTGTPCVMGRNVWSENVSGSGTDFKQDEACVMWVHLMIMSACYQTRFWRSHRCRLWDGSPTGRGSQQRWDSRMSTNPSNGIIAKKKLAVLSEYWKSIECNLLLLILQNMFIEYRFVKVAFQRLIIGLHMIYFVSNNLFQNRK